MFLIQVRIHSLDIDDKSLTPCSQFRNVLRSMTLTLANE
jgi:hypothetical protein